MAIFPHIAGEPPLAPDGTNTDINRY